MNRSRIFLLCVLCILIPTENAEAQTSRYGPISDSDEPEVAGKSPSENRYESKVTYGSYGSVSEELAPEKYIRSSGNSCVELEPSQSPYVSQVCVEELEVVWNASSMLGEPVFKYEVSYELSSCLYLRKVYGQQVVGSGRKVCQSPSNVHGRNALSAHQNVRISDMDIAIAVYSNKDLAALGLGSKWPRNSTAASKVFELEDPLRIVIADIGSPGKSGESSFNVGGSPNWDRTFLQFNYDGSREYRNQPRALHSDIEWGSLQATCSMYKARDEDALGEAFFSASEAKSAFNAGITMKKPSICAFEVGSLSAVDTEIQNWCAYIIGTGKTMGQGTQELPCRGDEKPSFGSLLLKTNLDDVNKTGSKQFVVSGSVDSNVLNRNLQLSFLTGNGRSSVSINSQGNFSIPMELAVGRNAVNFELLVDGIPNNMNYSIVFDPEFFAAPFSRFQINGSYGYKDSRGRIAVPAKYPRADELFDGFACVRDQEGNYRIVSIAGEFENQGLSACSRESAHGSTYFIAGYGESRKGVLKREGDSLQQIIEINEGEISFDQGVINVAIRLQQAEERTVDYEGTGACGEKKMLTRSEVRYMYRYENYDPDGQKLNSDTQWGGWFEPYLASADLLVLCGN